MNLKLFKIVMRIINKILRQIGRYAEVIRFNR